jgi:hypothetical protein
MKRKLTPKDFVGLPFKKRRAGRSARPRCPRCSRSGQYKSAQRCHPRTWLVMKMAVVVAARHVQAAAILCSVPGTRAEVVAYTDDFFLGHEDIAMPPPRKRRPAR